MRTREAIPGDRAFSSNMARLSAYTVPFLMSVTVGISALIISRIRIIDGFKLKHSHTFTSLNVTAYLYVHTSLGCQFLDIESHDHHNYFSTTFKTTPFDDSGVFNAIKKMIQQGSTNYNVRNLFTEMKKRSIATSFDALNSDEWTAFQLSTTNHKDFMNLLSVHLDAVFNPIFDETDFLELCHRLEASGSTIYRTGILYNEIKENYENPNSFFHSKLRESLYNGSQYHYQYSGTPSGFAELTVLKVMNVYKKYFHPSNALFFHYGSFPRRKILKTLSSLLLAFESIQPVTESSGLPSVLNPSNYEFVGPTSATTDLQIVKAGVAWMSGNMQNVSDVADFEFLSALLTDSSASPLYKGLITSGIGSRFVDTGYFPRLRTPYFAIGIDGFNPVFSEYTKTVTALLKQIVEHGFNQHRVETLLNVHEIRQKRMRASQGYRLWRQVIGSWIYGVNPLTVIDASWEIERLQRIITIEPKYFEMVMQKRLIENNDRIEVIMKGDTNFRARAAAAVNESIMELVSRMSDSEKEQIYQISNRLKSRDAGNDVSSLPCLDATDMIVYDDTEFDINSRVSTVELPLNGIVYVDIKARIPLVDAFLEDIPLLAMVLPRVGGGEMDDEVFARNQQLYTGGIRCSLKVGNGEDGPHAYVLISGSALSRNIEWLMTLFEKMILHPNLHNKEQIAALLSMEAADYEKVVNSQAQTLMKIFSAAGFSQAAALREIWSGFTGLKRTSRLVRGGEWDVISQKIRNAYSNLFSNAAFSVQIHCSESDRRYTERMCSDLLDKINKNVQITSNHSLAKRVVRFKGFRNQFFALDNHPSYVAVFSIAVPPEHASNDARFAVLAKLVELDVNENVGPVSATYDHLNRIISFTISKGKEALKIIDSIRECFTRVTSTPITDTSLVSAIRRVIADLDRPVTPSQRGSVNFLYNVSSIAERDYRTMVLSVNAYDIQVAARQCVAFEARSAVLGSENPSPSKFTTVDVADIDNEF